MKKKTCGRCKELKPIRQFHRRTGRKTGQGYCKKCQGKLWNATHFRNRSSGLCYCGREPAPGRTRCQSCIDSARKSLVGVKARFKELGICTTCYKRPTNGFHNCEECSARRAAKTNGADFKDRKELFEKQNRTCPICGEPLLGYIRKVHAVVDHDHETGKARGLLHNGCNLRLGDITLERAERIVKYLRGY